MVIAANMTISNINETIQALENYYPRPEQELLRPLPQCVVKAPWEIGLKINQQGRLIKKW